MDYPIRVWLYANNDELLSDGQGHYYFHGKNFQIKFDAENDKEAIKHVGKVGYQYHMTGNLP